MWKEINQFKATPNVILLNMYANVVTHFYMRYIHPKLNYRKTVSQARNGYKAASALWFQKLKALAL